MGALFKLIRALFCNHCWIVSKSVSMWSLVPFFFLQRKLSFCLVRLQRVLTWVLYFCVLPSSLLYTFRYPSKSLEGTFAPCVPTLLNIVGIMRHFFSLLQVVFNNTSCLLFAKVSSLRHGAIRIKLGALLRTLILLKFELFRVLQASFYIFGAGGSFKDFTWHGSFFNDCVKASLPWELFVYRCRLSC